ncbi:fimbrin [Entomophthora muscae]|uniref:Fimbrin n=1 Tax=Entomophthora muscae TaxID=34485 RepID=A0ACC2TCZ0_9FUNG|nr:fimbrin [Entomophthora muscae]
MEMVLLTRMRIMQLCSGLGTYDQIRATLKQVDTNANGTLELEEYFEIVQKLKAGEVKGVESSTNAFNKKVITVRGANQSDTAHTLNEEEKIEFTHYINDALESDHMLSGRLPIKPETMQLFDECQDGLILSKLINFASPETIDERVLNVGKKLNNFQKTENNNLVINSAKAIGCSVVNIGSGDLMEGREHLILGLIWQIIKIALLSKIDIKFHPELYRLLEKDENLSDFLKLPPETILLRWFNYHLKNAQWGRTVSNFSKDVKDGENYAVLLSQIAPKECTRAPLKENDLHRRAEMVLANAELIGCRKFLTPKTMLNGNPKLNLAFVAHLFNTHPSLEPLTVEEEEQVEAEHEEEEEIDPNSLREARAFALWLNSLNVDPYVQFLFEDAKSGLVLLQAIDTIQPNLVDWRMVNKPRPNSDQPLSRFKMVENTNYLISLGRQLNFSLVGVQGADITDGAVTLTLGLVWQIMRANVVKTLKSLSKGGRGVTDSDIIKWANDKVAGKHAPIRSFKDSSLRTGHFLLALVNELRPGIVDETLLTPGHSEDDAKLNALYAISLARKMNATIFLLPEDIIEVKPKMVTLFY